MLTAERLREVLNYDPETGILTWRVKPSKNRAAGSVAGSAKPGKRGYICVDYQDYLQHRVIWLYVHGEWPSELLDHINGDPGDNRLCNLRLATHQQNHANSRVRSHSKLGIKGVQEYRNSGKFIARISVNKRIIHLGTYESAEQAHQAYLDAAKKHFGEFACDGRRD